MLYKYTIDKWETGVPTAQLVLKCGNEQFLLMEYSIHKKNCLEEQR